MSQLFVDNIQEPVVLSSTVDGAVGTGVITATSGSFTGNVFCYGMPSLFRLTVDTVNITARSG